MIKDNLDKKIENMKKLKENIIEKNGRAPKEKKCICCIKSQEKKCIKNHDDEKTY